MKNIVIPECRVARFSETKIGLNITLEIKEEDAYLIRKDLRDYYKDGTLLATAMTVIEKTGPEIDEIVEKENKVKELSDRNYLRKLINEYYGSNNAYRDWKKNNKIESSKELSNEQITGYIMFYEKKLQIKPY